jgi:hypothetical protein
LARDAHAARGAIGPAAAVRSLLVEFLALQVPVGVEFENQQIPLRTVCRV